MDVVFNGKLISIDTIHIKSELEISDAVNEIWYTFQVMEYFKGKRHKETIRLRSGVTNAEDCKFVFLLYQSYVVYANHPLHKNFKKNKSILETSTCTHTGAATEERVLEARKRKK